MKAVLQCCCCYVVGRLLHEDADEHADGDADVDEHADADVASVVAVVLLPPLETVDSATDADVVATVPHVDAAVAPVWPNDALHSVRAACAAAPTAA